MRRTIRRWLRGSHSAAAPAFDRARYQDLSAEQWALIEYARPYTMTTPERMVHLIASVHYIHANRVPGAIVECGVWRGGSMIIVARVLHELSDCTRDLFLFDTFEGMPPPSDKDREHSGASAQQLLQSRPKTQDDVFWAYSPIEEVEANMRATGYPSERIHLIKGKVEDTIPNCAPHQIALLRLDTDWYDSTLHELNHLYDRLVRHGVLIIDDYGWWQGARQAVDEFFERQAFKPLLNRIDNTARSMVKV
jgi:O-methyltransferase